MSKQYIKSLLLCIIITSSYAIVFFESSFVQSIGREDGPIENIGAIFFIIASCLFFICYKISVGRGNDFWIMNTNRNLFYLLLAGLFLICFGEEISWGQRIFGWNTPETWTDINAQKETNFHNLWVFQTTNPDGSRKSFLELFLNMSRLFSMFWLFYCVLVPMVNHYSEKAKTLFDQVSLPICPLWLSFLFLANFFVFQIVVSIYSDPSNSIDSSLNELKETNYALIFMVFAIYEYVRSRKFISNQI